MSKPSALAALLLTGLLAGLLPGFLACSDEGSRGAAVNEDGSARSVFQHHRRTAYKTLDPMKQFDQASAELIMNLYDTLVEYHYLKRPYELQPALLAEMPVRQPDGRSYRMTLREGVRFQDDACFEGGKGRELNVDDAIYSIKRFADANVNNKSWPILAGFVVGLDDFREQTREQGKGVDYEALEVAGLRRIDDRTLEIEFTEDNPLALLPFAMTSMSIVPREAVEHYGDDFAHHPVGTGPFRIKQLNRRGMTVLEKNPDYWGTYPSEGAPGDAEAGLLDDAGKALPLVDEVTLPLIEESQPAMLKFLAGELDWKGIDKDNFPRMAYQDEQGEFHLKGDFAEKYRMYVEPQLSAEYFSFNLKDEYAGNRALRQAIAYAVDTPGYIKLILNGRALPLATIVPHPIAGSERDIGFEYYEQDLDKAREKLAEAGFPGGEGLPELVVELRSTTKDQRQAFEYLRNDLAQVGIKVKGNFNTFSAFLKRIESGNFQIGSAGWAADYPDAENFYQLLYGPNRTPGPNSSTFDHPEYNALYEQIRFMPNGPERFALFTRMSEIVKEEVPLLLRFNGLAFGLYQPTVRNMKRNIMVDLPLKYLGKDPS